jgi:AcrR family transcriptional regulator
MSAPTPAKPRRRTQEERSTATRTKLLDATIDCLIELGYADTTTTVIAERAGVSRGAQLHHFPTKAQLVAAAVEHLSSRIGTNLQEEAAKLPESQDRVSAALELLWSRFSAPLFPAYLELLVASRTDDELRASLQQVEDKLRLAILKQCREIFGESATAEPGYARTIELTLYVMQGMAFEQAVGAGPARNRKRRQREILDIWKRTVPVLLAGVSPSTDASIGL